MHLTGNTILITGGGSGIGRGLAEAFHARGNQVIIAGRRLQVLDETTAANPGMQSLLLDIEDAARLHSFVSEVAAQFPALNVLVNNAGIMRLENLKSEANDLAAAEATITTNLLGPIRLTSALLPLLQKQAKAAIINVTSGLAFVPMAITPTYCATKAALHSYTQSLRYQFQDTSVEVLELIPPYVQTELMGARQANDPNAMPLDAFIAESMEILGGNPTPPEICVKTVDRLRYAAESGHYAEVFKGFNDQVAAGNH
jgi:uncharacterized oxidoreductase